ncbi:MAG: lytic murein transglycosylase [Duodenibacillus massiliensis]
MNSRAFLRSVTKTTTDPTTVTGGFAGALGICQFMPSNIEKLGIDMDGDGKVDLTASTADAVASAANYLKSVGWDNRLPVTWPCRVSEASPGTRYR